ncbi:velvet factor [Chlamydoabsidia padenii]|nr:velvet factor [Chlamydoabsidia padenii]
MSSGTHLFKPSVSNDIILQPSEYNLSVLQQPDRVRVSTLKEKGRKSLDPPPIIQLHLPQRSEQESLNLLQSPCLYMCANLAHPRDDNEVYTPSHNALSGQVVSSLYKLTNEQNEVNGYFVFGDLSVKVNGVFRLKMSLFEITSEGSIYKSSIFSDPFTAYSTRTYPGTLEPTPLSKLFYIQGARLRLPKDYGASNQK